MSPNASESGAMPVSEAVDLVGLVSYQDGSIVSRTLASRDGGSVTLFAFAAGQSLSEHTAPFDALVHVLDGSAELTIGGETLTAIAGRAVLMPANIPHALHASTPFKMLLIMLRGLNSDG